MRKRIGGTGGYDHDRDSDSSRSEEVNSPPRKEPPKTDERSRGHSGRNPRTSTPRFDSSTAPSRATTPPPSPCSKLDDCFRNLAHCASCLWARARRCRILATPASRVSPPGSTTPSTPRATSIKSTPPSATYLAPTTRTTDSNPPPISSDASSTTPPSAPPTRLRRAAAAYMDAVEWQVHEVADALTRGRAPRGDGTDTSDATTDVTSSVSDV